VEAKFGPAARRRVSRLKLEMWVPNRRCDGHTLPFGQIAGAVDLCGFNPATVDPNRRR
jgi:hypothetical protein